MHTITLNTYHMQNLLIRGKMLQLELKVSEWSFLYCFLESLTKTTKLKSDCHFRSIWEKIFLWYNQWIRFSPTVFPVQYLLPTFSHCYVFFINSISFLKRYSPTSFINHCTEGISIIKGFSSSNVLVAASCVLWMNSRPEGDVAIFAGASVWKLNRSQLLKKFVTYLFPSLYTCGSKI